MFWNIDVKEQEQDLMAVSHFLLSVFKFAADQPGNVFLKEDWLAFAPENGAWFYRLYERDTENGKNMAPGSGPAVPHGAGTAGKDLGSHKA